MASASSKPTSRPISRKESFSNLSTASARDEVNPSLPEHLCLTVVVLGASGDLAKKKTFPALFTLYTRGFLPKNLRIIGYARSVMTAEDLCQRLRGYFKGELATQDNVQQFLNLISYVSGSYDKDKDYQRLQEALEERESKFHEIPHGRLFYLALPPPVYPQVCKGIKENVTAMSAQQGSWLRLIVEKPFGFDLDTSEELAAELGRLFPEDQLYRIDHYLGKELMQNMTVLRFSNTFMSPMWNGYHISNVQISFKEDFGTDGRGGYFDQFGIIRDVIQNHLIQVLALLAMEKPVSLNADDVRDEKVKVLRCIKPVTKEDVVLGQYVAANEQAGYLDDPTVPAGSKTPTFALTVLRIDNDRWAGVPFMLRAGKALNEKKVEIRVQFKAPPSSLNKDPNSMRNELVMRLQPDEAIYLKLALKKPGLEMEEVMSELDLTYRDRYSETYIPDAYERLILDTVRGDQQHFVRRDELRAAWAIFTPLLHAIDDGEIEPVTYPAGSRGPPASDAMIAANGYVQNRHYTWGRKRTGDAPVAPKPAL